MPIPEFVEPTGYLPPGRHEATWLELADRLATNTHRRILTAMLLEGLQALREAGCNRVWVNGSYVTDRERPGDVDVLYDAWGVRPKDLHPYFRTETTQTRKDRKETFGGDYLAVYDDELDGALIVHFQTDRADIPKGIIQLSLTTLPPKGQS